MVDEITDVAPRGDNALTQVVDSDAAWWTSNASMDLVQRAAKLLAASSIVPKNFQGSVPDCVIALQVAQRLGMEPLSVMQSLHVIHGKPSFSAAFLIASWNACGRYSAIDYEMTGTEGTDTWGCVAISTRLEDSKELRGPEVTIKMAKDEGWHGKSGSKWKTLPQLMLRYRAATFLIRTTDPALSLGLMTAEENGDIDGPRVRVKAEAARRTLAPIVGEGGSHE